MLRSPAATSSATVVQGGAVDAGEVMVAAVPRQHHVGAQTLGGTGQFVDQLGGELRHVHGADESVLEPGLRGRPQPAAGGQQRTYAAHLVAKDLGVQLG